MLKRLPQTVAGIYRISCIASSKVYIGRSMCIRVRWNDHRQKLNNGTHENCYLLAAWRKYGAEAFTFEVIERIDGLAGEELDIALRNAEIAAFRAHPQKFNLIDVLGTSLVRSPETCAKASASRKALWANPEFKEKMRAIHKARHQDTEFAAKHKAGCRSAVLAPGESQRRSDRAKASWDKRRAEGRTGWGEAARLRWGHDARLGPEDDGEVL